VRIKEQPGFLQGKFKPTVPWKACLSKDGSKLMTPVPMQFHLQNPSFHGGKLLWMLPFLNLSNLISCMLSEGLLIDGLIALLATYSTTLGSLGFRENGRTPVMLLLRIQPNGTTHA
jgi:hypothetical protein